MTSADIGGFIGCYRFTDGERTHRWFFTIIFRFFTVELSVVRFARGPMSENRKDATRVVSSSIAHGRRTLLLNTWVIKSRD